MLGHPAFVAGDVGGDAQSEAFLAEQGVAAVSGAVGPDLAGFGEVDDVFFVVAGPGDVLFPGRERHADRVHAGHDALDVACRSRSKTGRPMRAMMRMFTTT